MFAKTFLLTGLAYVASAHMLMSNPVPYGKSTLDNAPLLPDGSNFPCKMRGNTYDAQGASNVYAQGSTQQLEFIGSAVHGGGSCQVSITTDVKPDKNSVWKVIKSIEGGCPARDQAGNMPENPNAIDPYKYDFTIPKELAAGEYTLAWTWFNKIGNREMYMNCAPLTVTGSGGSKSHLDTLPNMFVANLGGACTTEEDTDVQFANPGNDVDRFNGATDAFKMPDVTACGGPTGSQPVKTKEPAAPAAPTTPASKPSVTSAPGTGGGGNGGNGGGKSIPGGVFITVAEPDTDPVATQPVATQPVTTQPVVTQPAATQPATTLVPVVSTPVMPKEPVATTTVPQPGSGSGGSPGSSPGSGSGSGSYAAGTACTSEGNWNCIGGSTFQRCASGVWSAPQALSQGVTCTPGQSADIGLSAKRASSFMRRSLRIRA